MITTAARCVRVEIALSTQRGDLLAEEVPRASSWTWRRLFRGMKSSKLPRQVDSIRAESSSNGSWRCHRALLESLRTRAFRLHMLRLSFLSSFVSPLLPLGLGLLLVRGFVRRLMFCRIGLLFLAVRRYGYLFSSSSSTGST